MTHRSPRDDHALDERIGDFLDGRMTPTDHAAFAARVAREPVLRARVEGFREIGRALRDSEVALPADLVARARQRFEAASGRAPVAAPRARPRWRVPLAATGLVAASVTLVLLFLPPDRRPAAPPDDVGFARPAPATVAPPAAEAERDVQPTTPVQATDKRTNELGQASAAPSALPAPAERVVDEIEAAREGEARLQKLERQAPEPRRLVVRGVALPVPPAVEAKSAADAPEPNAARAAGARADAAGARGVVRIDSADSTDWLELISTAEGRALASRLAPDFASEQVVLVLGASTAGACAAAAVETTPAEIVVRLAARPVAGAEEPEPGRGCALVLPRDPRPVRIVE
jgi:hypothetical protein